MRVLLSCLQSLTEHSIPAYGFWRNYFVEGLNEAGHEVVEVPNVDWAEGLTYPTGSALDSWRARTWGALEEFVKREHARNPIHLFLCYLYPKQVDGTTIRELRRIGIPSVNFFCDNVREFSKVPTEYRAFTLHWVPEFEALPMYCKAGLPFVHAPMPCWIPTELRTPPYSETEPPTFIGSSDVLRRDLLARAFQGGADFIVIGRGWKPNAGPNWQVRNARSVSSLINNQWEIVRQHGLVGLWRKLQTRLHPMCTRTIPEYRVTPFVSHAEYIRFSREAIVTIGANRVPSATRSPHRPLVYSRLRDIEAPMLGACYLTEWTQGLEHMYDLGTEIETYKTPDELCSKLHELGLDRSRRNAMRARAQRRALADHSVPRSISRICAHLGLARI